MRVIKEMYGHSHLWTMGKHGGGGKLLLVLFLQLEVDSVAPSLGFHAQFIFWSPLGLDGEPRLLNLGLVYHLYKSCYLNVESGTSDFDHIWDAENPSYGQQRRHNAGRTQ